MCIKYCKAQPNPPRPNRATLDRAQPTDRAARLQVRRVYERPTPHPTQGMNCLLEVLAGAYIRARQKMVGEVPEDDVHGAQEGLEQCRRNMESREAALAESAKRLAGEAVQKRRQNDPAGARAKVMERRRVQQRLDKLRNGISIVDAQLDTIRNSELDKEIMQSLKASTTALKRAGVGVVVADAENIMQVCLTLRTGVGLTLAESLRTGVRPTVTKSLRTGVGLTVTKSLRTGVGLTLAESFSASHAGPGRHVQGCSGHHVRAGGPYGPQRRGGGRHGPGRRAGSTHGPGRARAPAEAHDQQRRRQQGGGRGAARQLDARGESGRCANGDESGRCANGDVELARDSELAQQTG